MSARRRWDPFVVGVVVLCAWCGWVSGFHRTTAAAVVTWVVSLIGVVAIDVSFWLGRAERRGGLRLAIATHQWPRPKRGGARLALWGIAPWLGLILLVVAWDVLALDSGPHEYHLTISALSQAFRALNAALLLVWILVGVAYGAVRARSPAIAGQPELLGGPHAACIASLGAGRAHSPWLIGLLLPSNESLGVTFWLVVPVAAAAIDQVGRRSEGRVANAEEFLRFISTATAAKVALVAAWTFAGYHLFAR
jgi:hypothetical protein